MAELHAHIVSLTWEGGLGSVQPLVAATPAHAGAIAVANSLRQPDAPTGPLVGVMHTEVPLEWLRWAIRSIESGSTTDAPVLALVPKEEMAGHPQPAQDSRQIGQPEPPGTA